MFLKAFLVLEWFLSIQQRAVVGVVKKGNKGNNEFCHLL